jgi:hypothetical protein
MKIRGFFIGSIALLALASVAAARASARVTEVTAQTVNYKGWADSVRLTNGTAEVVIVPAVGRILRYGYVGGPNLIWEDPLFHGKPADRKNFPRFGGNKAWPWPQDEWPAHIGHDWPPPPAADQAPFTATLVGTDTIRMRSPLVVGFGVNIVREITLAKSGSQVTITTRLEHVEAPGPVQSLGAWSITPVAAPDTLLVRRTPTSPLASGYKPLGAFDPFARITEEAGLLTVERQPTKSSKIGIDGDAIAAVYGDTLWILRDTTPQTPGRIVPGERVQIYANADSAEDTARGLPPYMELELTSPRRDLARSGDTVTLTEVWELRRLPADPDRRRGVIAKSLGRG